MAIVLRETKGSELTHAELDGNFVELQGKVDDRIQEVSALSSINIFDISNADFSGVTISTPIAYVKIKGTVNRLDADMYGNYIDDGYGNPTTTDLAFDVLMGIMVADDGDGTYSVSDPGITNLTQASNLETLTLTLPVDGGVKMNIYDLSIQILEVVDFETVGITTGISLA